ncbi:multidrug effflux MFS transporter [Hyphomonas sp.]|jgi:DHA1 family bicyclomycin/chloramphenicol resistance-like MFS transporter|uniref:multidrug effflux MFS transporter n=1 Tax=Hyphomonas sp. TaxID=87 RepID=UPI0032D91106
MVIMVAALMALNALAIDIMLPALGQIAESTGLTGASSEDSNRQQMIVFAYVLGFGAPQLVWGPISDRFGRRMPLFIGLIGYSLTALLCIALKDFHALLAARFLQGVFASGARLVAVSVVRDLYAGRRMAGFMSLVMTIFMVVPMIAPAMGQMILFVAPWEWIFGVLALFGTALLAWTWLRLPETLPQEARTPLNISSAFSSYLAVARSRITFGYMCASGVIFGALFSFIGSSEQVFRDVFKQEETFAFWFAGVAGALACANFFNSRMVEKIGMRRISHAAMIFFILMSTALALVTYFFGESLLWFFPMFALTFACFGLMGANFSALAMEPLGKIAGTASAAYGFATTTVSSLLGILIGSYYNGTTLPLIIGFACLGVGALAIVLITEKGKLFSSR